LVIFFRVILSSLLVMGFVSPLFAGPDSFTLQGQIVKPDGGRLEAAAVDFLVQVYSPLPNKCLLYEERFSAVNMAGSEGIFNLRVGTGTQLGGDFEDSSSLTAILNNQAGPIAPTTCEAGGPNYNPGSSDERLLRLSFDDGGGSVTLAEDQLINSVPFAQYAKSVDGLGAADIIKVNIGTALSQSNLETIFATPSDVTDLRSLIDGNSSDYLASAPAASVGFNNQRITDVATPTVATDAANKNYVDTNLGGNTLNTGSLNAGDTGEVLTWNGAQWISQALTASGDVNNGGNAFTGLMTVGTNDPFGLVLETNNVPAVTIDNSQGVSLAAGLGVTGGVNSGGNVSLLEESEVRFEDAADGEFIGFKAPTALTASQTFTLPNGDGASGEFLQTNGSGVLDWAAPASGDHGGLSGLADDDHGQYALLAGRSGGQTLTGGTAASNNLTLESTSNATKGDILLNPSGGNVGIGTTNATSTLHVERAGAVTVLAKSTTNDAAVVVSAPLANKAHIRFARPTGSQAILGIESGSLFADFNRSGNNSSFVIRSTASELEVARFTGTDRFMGIGTSNPSTRLHTEGRITSGPIDATAGNTGSLVMRELAANGADSAGFRAPDLLAADLLWTLPSTLGTANQVLSNSSTPGVLEWVSPPSTTGFIAQGGNAFGNTMTIGTNDNFSVDFKTNGSSRATLGSDGRLQIDAIGSRSDANKANLNLTENAIITYNQSNTNPALEVFQESATSNGHILRLRNSTGVAANFDQQGHLGIGSTVPTAMIDIGGHDGIQLDADANQSTIISNQNHLVIGTSRTTASDDNIIFQGTNTGGTSEWLRIQGGTGNVGVGTDTPISKLDVEGRITAGPIDATSGNTGSLVMEELAANGTESVGFRAPDALGADLLWTLPDSLGTANQVLRNSATPGVLEWATPAAGTGAFLSDGSVAMTGNIQLGSNFLSGDGGNEGVFVAGNGNVGIGTSSPVERLQVEGGGILIDSDGDGDRAGITERNDGLALSAFENLSASTDLFIQEGGNVGIGTMSPTNKLEVEGVIRSTLGGFTFPDGTTMTTAATTGVGITNVTDVNIAADSDSNGSGSVLFATNAVERMRVDNGGSVGIGTASPIDNLHIYDSANSKLLLESGSGSSSALISFQNNANKWEAGMISNENFVIRDQTNGGAKVVEIEESAPAGSLFLRDNGNIGIGTTAPAYQLDVDGDINTTGSYFTNGADYAEYFHAEETLAEGDLVGINVTSGKVRGYKPGDKLLGVVSTNPGVLGNSELRNTEKAVLVALVGQVPVLSERIREDGGVVFTKDGQALGYRLGNGNIYLNLSSGSEALKREIASQELRLRKQEASSIDLETKISAQMAKISSLESSKKSQALEIEDLKRSNLEFQKRLERLETGLQK